MYIKVFLLTFLILSFKGFGQSNEELLNQLKHKTSNTTTTLNQYIADNLEKRMGEKYNGTIEEVDKSQLKEHMANIVKNYESQRDNHDVGMTILKSNNEVLIKGSIALGVAMAPATGGTSLILSGISYAADEGLAKVEEIAEKNGRESIRRDLKYRLDTYRKKEGKEAYDALSNIKDPVEFKKKLEESLGPIFDKNLDAIPSEDKEVVNGFYSKVLAETLEASLTSLNNVQAVQATQIETNQKNIIGFARTFKAFAEETELRLSSIEKNQVSIKGQLDNIEGKVDKTQEDVRFIQDFMFGEMSPEQRLASLKKGWFPEMPAAEREALEEKIQLEQDRQELITNISIYLNGANQLVGMAESFGVDPEIVEVMGDAVNIGSAAFNAVTAFASGNYLGAIGAVAGLFGPKKDAGQQRHEQVMKMLKAINQKLGVINEKVDKLLEGQQNIINNQIIILETLQAISNQIDQNHIEVIEYLQTIHGDLLYNRGILIEEFSKGYVQCDKCIRNSVNGDIYINTTEGKYPSYEEFVEIFKNNYQAYKDCIEILDNSRVPASDNEDESNFNSIFHLESYKDLDNNTQNYINNVFKPSINFLKAELPNSAHSISKLSLDEKYSLLLAPIKGIEYLDLKITNPINVWAPRYNRSFDNLFGSLLHTTAVKRHVEDVLNIHFYRQLVVYNGESVHTLSELIQNPIEIEFNFDKGAKESTSEIPKSSYVNLIDALSMIDIAVGQQNLLVGDILIPILSEVFDQYQANPDEFNTARYNQAINLLNYNSILAKNFLLYKLKHEIGSNTRMLSYDVALNSSDPHLLQQITKFNWQFEKSSEEVKEGKRVIKPKGWSVKIGNQNYALPITNELFEGIFVYHPDLETMLKLRKQIVEQLTTYEMFDGLSKQEQLLVNQSILEKAGVNK